MKVSSRDRNYYSRFHVAFKISSVFTWKHRFISFSSYVARWICYRCEQDYKWKI